MKISKYYTIKKKAWNFCKSIETLDIDTITLFLKKQNFTVKYFEPDDKNILELNPSAKNEKGFVYSSSALRMVCVLKHLSVKEKIKILIHETGHVLLDEDFDCDSYKQKKAVSFSKYVIRAFEQSPLQYKLWKHNNFLMFACIMVLSFVCFFVAYMNLGFGKIRGVTAPTNIEAENADATESLFSAGQTRQVYITPTGEKYHTKECSHIHLETAKTLTLEEVIKGNYAPCKHCIQIEK